MNNTILKEGWITKEGGGLFKNWKKRYAVLDYQTGTLSYYETQNHAQEKPLGIVQIRSSEVLPLLKSTKGKDNCFVIKSNDRTFFAYADNKDELEKWISALKEIAQETIAPPAETVEAGVKRQLHAGWLTKEAGSGRNWKKRWFVLDSTNLSYYKDKKDKTPQGIIYLGGAKVMPNPETSSPYLFVVDPYGAGSRKYRIKASSNDEMNFWIDQIQKAAIMAGKPSEAEIAAARSQAQGEEDDDDDVPPPNHPPPGSTYTPGGLMSVSVGGRIKSVGSSPGNIQAAGGATKPSTLSTSSSGPVDSSTAKTPALPPAGPPRGPPLNTPNLPPLNTPALPLKNVPLNLSVPSLKSTTTPLNTPPQNTTSLNTPASPQVEPKLPSQAPPKPAAQSLGPLYDDKSDQEAYFEKEKRFLNEIFEKGKRDIETLQCKFVDLYK